MYSNLFPVKIESSVFDISRVLYSEERLKTLRKEHNKTHSFFRNGDYIYVSNKTGENIEGTEKVSIEAKENSEIVLSLLRHVFFKTFLQKVKSRRPIGFHPFKLLSTRDSDDWIYEFIPDKFKGKIAYKKLIEMQFKELEFEGVKKYVCSVDVSRKWVFDVSCSELIQSGFGIVGREVLHSEPIEGLDQVLAPTEEFVGKIVDVKEGKAIVDSISGDIPIDLDELFLKKNTSNIKDFLTHITDDTVVERILNTIKNKRRLGAQLKNTWSEINEIIKVFAYTIPKLEDESIEYCNKEGFRFTIMDKPIRFSNSFNLSNPTFIFDKAGVKTTNNFPDNGLSNYGPYDSNVFHNKEPYILAICKKENRGRFTTFLESLYHGMPESKYFKKGFKGKFELHNINSHVEEISSYSISEFESVISSIEDKKPNLVIIELDDTIKSSNPLLYYEIKAKLLSIEVPLQVVLRSKMDNFNEYILNSIALQLYAKLGGVPWVLKSSLSVDRELVVGIGHATIRDSSYSGNKQDRFVGITSFFSSDGQYLLSNKAKEVPYDKYFDELLQNLESSFSQLEKTNNWKVGDTIRVIFHIFKPIKNVEYDVVASLLKKYGHYNIQFAFVTIGHNHPYKMFAQNDAYIGNDRKELVPIRGTNLKLDSTTCLVQMLGVNEIKSSIHNASSPVLIRIRVPKGEDSFREIESLLFQDLQYIVQQIYSFTNLSWRNFMPSEHPATLLYSELMAKQLGRLRKLENWNPDVLNFTLKTKKWFL